METETLLTPAFLTARLRSAGVLQHAAVTTVAATALVGQASFNAQLYRLHLEYDAAEVGAPTTLIAKLPTANAALRDSAAVFQPGKKEVWFYQKGAARTPVHIPRCYYAAVDKASDASMLVLEDLAPARTGNQVQGASHAEAQLALQALASIHAAWWGTDASEAKELEQPASDPEAAVEMVAQFYRQAWPRFREDAAFIIPPEVTKFGELLLTQMAAIEHLLDGAPTTLLHGDFRLENMLFGTQHGAPICWIIDWEDIACGNAMSDVAWFLGGCVSLDAIEQEEQLLAAYHTALAQSGVAAYPWAQCYHDYRCAMSSAFVQGVLMATPPETGDAHASRLGDAVGARFIQACQRLRLHELIS